MDNGVILYGPDDRPITAERRYEYISPQSLQDKGDIYSIFGYGPKSEDAKITAQKALTFSPWFRAMSLIASSVAKLPCVTSKRVAGGKERDTKHPAYNLLLYKPNREMTSLSMIETLQYHALSRGNGLAHITRDQRDGRPLELWPLHQDWVTLFRHGGELYYIIEIPGQKATRALADDVIHIKGLGSSGVWGFDVLSLAATSLAVGLAAQEYSWKFFKNGAMPGVVLTHPARFKNPQRLEQLRRSWEELYTGLSNSHKTAILEEGMEAKTLSIDAKNSQLVERLQYSIIDASNWTGVPPHKLGSQVRAAYNSLEQENQSFLDDCLDFWYRNFEMEFRDKLLTEREKESDSHIIEFMRQALVRADMKSRYAAYKTAVDGGWMSANDVRAKENENSIGPQGDIYRVPLNTTPADQVADSEDDETDDGNGEPTGDGADPDGNRAAMDVLENHAIGKIMRRIGAQATREAKHRDTFGEFLLAAAKDNTESAVDTLYPVLCVRSGQTGEAVMSLAGEAAKNTLRWAVKMYRDIWSNSPGSQFEAMIKAKTDTLAADAIGAKLLDWRFSDGK
jgi:HK97 family phage portal protein